MKKLFTIVRNDIRLIFRDKSMFVIFLVPVIMMLIFRIGVPLLTDLFPEAKEFYWLIIAAFTSVSAATPAYLIGFIILDERDENIHFLQQILPLPKHFILKSRVVFMILLAFVFSFILLTFNSLIHFTFIQVFTISVLFSLIPPILTFCIVAFSKNKIEAVTFYKGLSMVLVIPFAAFFISHDWKIVFGIVPFYWTYNAFQFKQFGMEFLLNFSAGIMVHLIYIWLFFKIYLNRMN